MSREQFMKRVRLTSRLAQLAQRLSSSKEECRLCPKEHLVANSPKSPAHVVANSAFELAHNRTGTGIRGPRWHAHRQASSNITFCFVVHTRVLLLNRFVGDHRHTHVGWRAIMKTRVSEITLHREQRATGILRKRRCEKATRAKHYSQGLLFLTGCPPTVTGCNTRRQYREGYGAG